MASDSGHGAQVVLSGVAQAAARGAVSGSQEGNLDARNAVTTLDNYGTPSQPNPDGGIDLDPLITPLFPIAANDAAAAAAGVPVGGFYRNTAGVQQRQA